MAIVYSSWSNSVKVSSSSTRKWRVWQEAYISTDQPTYVTIGSMYGVQQSGALTLTYRLTSNMAGTSETDDFVFHYSDGDTDQNSSEHYQTFTKGHTAVTKTYTVTGRGTNATSASGWNSLKLTATVNITVPAKPSYTVSYNMNGGSASIGNQTKWYGENLALSATKPTRSGYIFRGWATTIANATAGIVNYASGATYTGNAALSLYAVWHQVPSLVTDVTTVGPYYESVHNYTVDISDATVYKESSTNPTISSIVLRVGSQTATSTADGTLTISPLSAIGTFTPSVTITDSLGGTQTYNLSPITVNGYTAPSVIIDGLQRTLPNPPNELTPIGKPHDEGLSATITVRFNFIDVITHLESPTIEVKNNAGQVQTSAVDWYSSRSQIGELSNAVTWEDVAKNQPVYGLITINGEFDIEESYQISIVPNDTLGYGATISQTLNSAFFTIDFLAGGRGIAFGRPAIREGFDCDMVPFFKAWIGVVQQFAGTTAPTGWHLCDGSAVSRLDYAELFDVIGTTYGVGDGSTTFNLPNLSGRVPVGAGTSYALGTTGGSPYIQAHTHAFTAPTVPNHSHTVSGGAHTHLQQGWLGAAAGSKEMRARKTVSGDPQEAGSLISSGAHSHTIGGGTCTTTGGAVGAVSGATTGSAGNMQPYIVLNYIIYTGIVEVTV